MSATAKGIVEGVSNEVLTVAALFVIVVVGLIYKIRNLLPARAPTIHPDSEPTVAETRERLQPRSTREHGGDTQCPVCLDSIQYALETNCGHLFCGNCIVTYWRTGRWTGPVACPNCRQTVTVLLNSFTPNELREEDSQVKNQILREVQNYNGRFSGEPRTVWEYIQDLPALFRHAISDVFSVNGMVFAFRARIVLCIVLAVIYLLSPLDIIPEMAVGVLGFLDDIFIMFIFALYITMVYRSVLEHRATAAAAANHQD